MPDEYTAGQRLARLIEGVRDWLASGEQVVPPALAQLPDDEREQLMNAGREFRDAFEARMAELDRSGQEGLE
ncbi:MAG: hypothetical protein IRY92_00540 [Dactylosporangium sp.]|nr:hypothetical protein [Dactylosporangium sp.]